MMYILMALCGLFLVIILRTAAFKSKRMVDVEKADVNIDKESAVKKLSHVIKCKTISYDDSSKIDWNEFDKLQKSIEKDFPLVHKSLHKEIVNEHSLIFKWEGSDHNQKPILFLAHMDVVPIDEGTEKEWKCDPFSGEIKDGYVWGRGTLDIKIQMISQLESIEELLKKGYTPKRDIYLAFGHDEELGGKDGAKKISELFKERNIEFEYVIDEGGAIAEDTQKTLGRSIAFVGTCEKGFTHIRLKYKSEGGHSSMPSERTSLGVICDATSKLQKHQMKASLTTPVKDMIRYIGPELSFSKRMILANTWLFFPFMKKKILSIPIGNALLRTTTAVTMAQGSPAANVLPQESSATFNFRIGPVDSVGKVIEHIKNTIKNPDIEIEPLLVNNPSKVSSSDSNGFHFIEKTVYQIFPDILVTPFMVMAGSDSRHYINVCPNIYRFNAYSLTKSEVSGIHGINERISIENVENCVKFYTLLIINSNK